MFEESSDNSNILLAFQKFRKYLFAHFSARLLAQVMVFLCGLVISSFGLFQLFNNSVSASNYENSDISQVCTKDPEFGRLTVDMGGAVKNPGVYELEVGSRINDLVNIAGGFSSSVDKYYINKVLNLSQRINDGEKFYIPTLQESIEVQEQQQSVVGKESSQSNGGSNSFAADFISINSASKEALMTLVGIGEKRAGDIMDQRPYDSVQQLIEREVITESLFEDIENSISL